MEYLPLRLSFLPPGPTPSLAMWPWLTSSTSGYQPAANLPHPSTHYVTSQQQQQQPPLPSYPALPHTEYSRSHSAGMGIGYGLSSIGTRPPIGIGHSSMTTAQAVLQSVPDGTAPQAQGGVSYEDVGGVHRVHTPGSVVISPSSPSLHESTPHSQQQQSVTFTSLHSDSRSYHQTPPQLSATGGGQQPHPQPQHVGGYMTAAQHAHGSSPFSMDFILRSSDTTPGGGGSAEAVVPTYGGTSQPPEKGEVWK